MFRRIEQIFKHLKVEKATKAFIHSARQTPDFGIIDTLHGYLYARWPYFWISVGTGRHRLIRHMKYATDFVINALTRFPADRPWIDDNGLHPHGEQRWYPTRRHQFSDTYHGKVIRLDAAKQFVSLKQGISLRNLEKVIPYSTARDIILENPDRILALDCPCRAVRTNPCLPLDVCLVMGDPFIDLVTTHHAERSRFIDRSEAIDILLSEADRGHVHHAFFKEAALGRFFAVCNCCACCCGAMQAHRNGIPMLASSGYVCVVNSDKCEACGSCVEKCQFGAIRLIEMQLQIDPQTCMGCGLCAGFCSQNALSLKRDYARSDPLELDQLLRDLGQPFC